MIRLILLVFIIILIFTKTSYPNTVEQDKYSIISNQVIIDSLLNNIAINIVSELLSKNCDTVFITIKSNQADKYILNKILAAGQSSDLKFFSSTNDSLAPTLDYNCLVNTQYTSDPKVSNDILRTITIQISAFLKHNNNELSVISNEKYMHNDKISRSQGVLFNKSDYDFARSDLPAEHETFWKEIVQPIAFIGSAALTVFLLFTLRSR